MAVLSPLLRVLKPMAVFSSLSWGLEAIALINLLLKVLKPWHSPLLRIMKPWKWW